MHRGSFASEGTLPKATGRACKRGRGNAEAFKSLFPVLQGQRSIFQDLQPTSRGKPKFQGARVR